MFEAVRTNPGYGMDALIYNNLLNLILEVSRIESFWPKNLGQDFFCQ